MIGALVVETSQLLAVARELLRWPARRSTLQRARAERITFAGVERVLLGVTNPADGTAGNI